MSTSMLDMRMPEVLDVEVSEHTLRVELSDGRTLSVPSGWYPRLLHATEQERGNWTLIDEGRGIHWQDLDEDVSLEGLLAGRTSRENQASLKRWLDGRLAERVE